MQKFDHVEAYKLMTYKNLATGKTEIIWNSRDGVTSFMIPDTDGGRMQHIDWDNDELAIGFYPPPGTRVFIGPASSPSLVTAEEYHRLMGQLDDVTESVDNEKIIPIDSIDRKEMTELEDTIRSLFDSVNMTDRAFRLLEEKLFPASKAMLELRSRLRNTGEYGLADEMIEKEDLYPELVRQPTSDSCTAACLAMATGMSIDYVMEDFHREYLEKGTPFIHEWLDKHKIEHNMTNISTPISPGMYLMCLPSLNALGKLHSVLAFIFYDCTDNICWRVIDPMRGVEDALVYSTDLKDLANPSEDCFVKVNHYVFDLKFDGYPYIDRDNEV